MAEELCACSSSYPKACTGPAKYEHDQKHYCVLHYPVDDKLEDFRAAVARKLTNRNFHFEGAVFPADFSQFMQFQFDTEANFSEATFTGEVDFSEATFSEKLNFHQATFKGKANFEGATFSARVYFIGATFSEGADFIGSTFSEGADFGGRTSSALPSGRG